MPHLEQSWEAYGRLTGCPAASPNNEYSVSGVCARALQGQLWPAWQSRHTQRQRPTPAASCYVSERKHTTPTADVQRLLNVYRQDLLN
jgi:hypothetical protein